LDPKSYTEISETQLGHWWFVGRRSIIRDLISRMHLPKAAKILEVGCGPGGNLNMLNDFGFIKAFEMSKDAIAMARKQTNNCFDIKVGSCPNDIPFEGEKFDLICMFDVLEHIDEDGETLIVLKKLLKDNGKLLITVPAYQWLYGGHDKLLHHKRRYSFNELTIKAKSSGYQVEKLTYFNCILSPIALAVRVYEKIFSGATPVGASTPNKLVNNILCCLFKSEKYLLRYLRLPFGISLIGIFSIKK
jgi:SAM-dependent methyltransferase